MFNRQPFNRGKFNISSKGELLITGSARMSLGTTPTKSMKEIFKELTTSMNLKSTLIPTIEIFEFAHADLIMGGNLLPSKFILIGDVYADLIMSTEASQTLGDEESIYLPGLTLNPGQELVINTTDYTITLDGRSVMRYFDRYSIFFDLLSGDNFIEYSDDNDSRFINIDILWKDRWL